MANTLDSLTTPLVKTLQRLPSQTKAASVQTFLSEVLRNTQEATGATVLATLTTTLKTTLAAAINELDTHADALLARDGGLINAASVTKIVADLAALRTTVAALVVDVANVVTEWNTLTTKLNADGGVTDSNYAAATAQTSSAPAAMTAAVPGTTILGQGGTAGRIKLLNDIEFEIAGQHYRKAPTDNLWNLSALGTTDGTHYKAVRLYLDSSLAASVDAGTAATSSALAKAALPAIDLTKACVGVYVMGLSGNFASALDAQGTYVDGWSVVAFT